MATATEIARDYNHLTLQSPLGFRICIRGHDTAARLYELMTD